MGSANNIFLARLPKRTQWLLVAIVAALALGGLSTWWLVSHRSATVAPQGFDPYIEKANELAGQAAPSDPLQAALYYAQLGQAYAGQEQWTAALTNYMQAQATLDGHGLDQIAFYEPIAQAYERQGNHRQAKVYLSKQVAYLQKLQKTNPDDGGAIQAGITTAQKRISEL